MGRRIFLLLTALSFPSLLLGGAGAGCGSDVVQPGEAGGGGAGGDDGSGAGHPTGPGPGGKDGGGDALPDYVDPGCPDAGPAITDFQCDPYAQSNGDCAFDEGCFIYVAYPMEPCGQEVYGAQCHAAGFGKQGDACNGGQDCDGGFVCVVSGSGTQCVKLCKVTGDDGCPAGLVCEPIDVQGFGGCL